MSRNPCQFGLSYGSGCRCTDCRTTKYVTQKRYLLRKRARARGAILPEDYIDVEPARTAINEAWNRGVTLREQQRITGISKHKLSHIRLGKQSTITRKNSRAILRGLQDPEVRAIDDETLVDTAWARAMARGLAAQGWSFAHQKDIIYNNLNVNPGFHNSIVSTHRTWCLAKNEQHIKWLVKVLGNKTGPSKKSQTIMRNKGVFPIKHYNLRGELIESTLSAEQKQFIKRVP